MSVMLAVVGAGFAANGQTAPTDSKGSEAPQVHSVTSPTFNPTNYTKVAIVWTNPPKPTPGDSSQQSIDDEFTFALVQKGYDVIAPSDTQSLLKGQQVTNSPTSTEPSAMTIGKLLNVPAVMVISVSGLTSKPYVAPPPQPAGASSTAGGAANPLAGVSNPLSLISMPTNSYKYHGWGINLPNETPPKSGAQPNAAQPRAPAPAAAPKAAPQFMNSCSMSARLSSSEDDRILWIGKVTVNSVSSSAQDFSDSVRAAADAIAGAIPSRIEEPKK